MDPWMAITLLLLVGVQLVLLVGLVLNVNKILGRATEIRRQLQKSEELGAGPQLTEAVTQLQSIAVSLDRIALRCDALDAKVGELQRGAPSASSAPPEMLAAVQAGLAELRAPLAEIRDLLGRTKTERLADDIRRTLHAMGYDRVTIKTDLESLDTHDGRVQVEVARAGVVAKGYVVVRDGGVVDQKLSNPYEAFP